ncbi:transposase [Mycobacterium avium subsp. hominissuis]|nr:transposase [Mycobacterium avium subsp. hominissuis]MBZ4531258.1 transposase [Mycobacterium avium subsp. hominissuis]
MRPDSPFRRRLRDRPDQRLTTGKIERSHRSFRADFHRSAAPFANLKTAQRVIDEWVDDCNTNRPHQALKMATSAQRSAPARRACSRRRRQACATSAPAISGSAAGGVNSLVCVS